MVKLNCSDPKNEALTVGGVLRGAKLAHDIYTHPLTQIGIQSLRKKFRKKKKEKEQVDETHAGKSDDEKPKPLVDRPLPSQRATSMRNIVGDTEHEKKIEAERARMDNRRAVNRKMGKSDVNDQMYLTRAGREFLNEKVQVSTGKSDIGGARSMTRAGMAPSPHTRSRTPGRTNVAIGNRTKEPTQPDETSDPEGYKVPYADQNTALARRQQNVTVFHGRNVPGTYPGPPKFPTTNPQAGYADDIGLNTAHQTRQMQKLPLKVGRLPGAKFGDPVTRGIIPNKTSEFTLKMQGDRAVNPPNPLDTYSAWKQRNSPYNRAMNKLRAKGVGGQPSRKVPGHIFGNQPPIKAVTRARYSFDPIVQNIIDVHRRRGKRGRDDA